MSASSSQSSQTTSTSSSSISDSYNQTFSKVFNLSNAGNVNITPPVDDTSTKILPYVLGFMGILALAIFFK